MEKPKSFSHFPCRFTLGTRLFTPVPSYTFSFSGVNQKVDHRDNQKIYHPKAVF